VSEQLEKFRDVKPIFYKKMMAFSIPKYIVVQY